MDVNIFLSSVTSEAASDPFNAETSNIRRYIWTRLINSSDWRVYDQSNFVKDGRPVLDLLDKYISDSHVIVHIVGLKLGWTPTSEAVEGLIAGRENDFRLVMKEPFWERRHDLSATQWEYWLSKIHGLRILPVFLDEHFLRSMNPTHDGVCDELQAMHRNHLLSTDSATSIKSKDKTLTTLGDEIFAGVQRTYPSRLINGLRLRLPQSLGAKFVGRDSDINMLVKSYIERDRQQSPLTQVLIGPTGIGKTAMATELAHVYARQAPGLNVIYFNGLSSDTWSEDLATMGEAVSPLTGNLMMWLKDPRNKWLVVLNGVDDEETYHNALEMTEIAPNGNYLITSRRTQGWNPEFELHFIKGLTEEEAIRMLRSYLTLPPTKGFLLSKAEEALLSEVVGQLQGNPLAIRLGAAFVKLHPSPRSKERSRLAAYLKTLRSVDTEWLTYTDKEGVPPLASAWRTTFDGLWPPARTLLRLLAFLTDQPIPVAMLESTKDSESDFREAVRLDPLEKRSRKFVRSEKALLRRAIQDLSQYSLADDCKTSADSILLHKSSQEFALYDMRFRGEEKGLWKASIELFARVLGRTTQPTESLLFPKIASLVGRYVDKYDEDGWNRVYGHVFSLIGSPAFESVDVKDDVIAHTNGVGRLMIASALRRRQADGDIKSAMEICHAVIENTTESTDLILDSKMLLADCFSEQSKSRSAIRVCQEIVDALPLKCTEGKDIKRLYRALSIKGWAHRFLGETPEGRLCFERGLESIQQLDSPPAGDEIDLRAGLAAVADYDGRYKDAADVYRALYEELCQLSGDGSKQDFVYQRKIFDGEDLGWTPDTIAYVLYLFGWFLIRQGSPDLGEHTCKEAVKISSKEEFNLGGLLNESCWILAVHFAKTGDLEEAKNYIGAAIQNMQELTEAWVSMIAGLIHLVVGDKSKAYKFLQDGLSQASKYAVEMPESFDFLDTKAFSLAGLDLLGESQDISVIRETYSAARSLCNRKGVVDIGRFVFSIVEKADEPNGRWMKYFGAK